MSERKIKRNKTVVHCISIPRDLKMRMDAHERRVNWSAVAARAFEKVLGLKDVPKSVRDPMARPRSSTGQYAPFDSDPASSHNGA